MRLHSLFMLSLALPLCGLGRVPARAADPPPNILLLVADDLGYADLGFQGSREIQSPHLDGLAAGGVRCTSGYVGHPFCSPTRAALLTGRYQHRFGHENNPAWLPQDPTVGLPLTEKTLADHLKRAGYVTGAVGKWHLGAHPTFHPNRRGFDEYFGLLGGGHQYFPVPRTAAEYAIPLDRNGQAVDSVGYLTTQLGEEAGQFVARHAGKPWLLYCAFNAPHTPLQAPKEYLDRYPRVSDVNRRTYAAMVTAMDDAVGTILRKLAETGQERNTLVFFLSDNGGPHLATRLGSNFTDNAPFRGAKGQVYEGGIRVPFVARWPAKLRAGRQFDHPVTCRDILPTALTAAGVALPKNLDGRDILPNLSGRRSSAPHKHLVWRQNGNRPFAVRQDRWKLVQPATGDPELYDLRLDWGEQTNVANEHPDRVKALQRAYSDWNREMVPPLWQNPAPAPRANRVPAPPGA